MKAVGVVFSNIHDKEIKELTVNRTLASVPFGGRFRLIDFVLSNMVNSGINKVGIITRENYQSLMDHIGSGKHWDLSRKNGGIIILPPFGVSGSVLYDSRFQAIKNIVSFLRRCDEDYVVMSDSDSVCNFDFSKVIERHIATNAEITAVYRKKDVTGNAKRRTVFEIDQDNRVRNVSNASTLSGVKNIYTNMLVINRALLLNIIEMSAERGFNSFSSDILTRCDMFRIFGYELEGFFASIDSLSNYYKHSIELLDTKKRNSLFSPDSSIYTKVRDSAPCRIEKDAKVSNSLIADGCVIEGEVHNSILFRGVKVAKGAVIKNSILFQDTQVGEGTSLNCVIADKQVTILSQRTLSGHETQPYFIYKATTV